MHTHYAMRSLTLFQHAEGLHMVELKKLGPGTLLLGSSHPSETIRFHRSLQGLLQLGVGEKNRKPFL